MRSAIVLAGGKSTRLESNKHTTEIAGKPLLRHVIDHLKPTVEEILIIISSLDQLKPENYPDCRLIPDIERGRSPLMGAYTGFTESRGDYTFMTGGDYPLLDKDVIELLFEAADGHNASTPMWPNSYVEPLHAVYRTSAARKCSESLLKSGESRLRMILRNLDDVQYLPIEKIRKIDPELYTLKDVDSVDDLRKIENILRSLRVS